MKYVWISSSQNKDKFPDNQWYDFRVELPKELIFKDCCECALLSFDVNPLFQLEVNIFCDLLEENCFGNNLAPYLNTVDQVPYRYQNLTFVKVLHSTIKTFRIYIKSMFSNSIPSESIGESSLLLVFREFNDN